MVAVALLTVATAIASGHVSAEATAAAPANAGGPPTAAADRSTASGAVLSISTPSAGDTALAADARILCADEIVSALYLTVFNVTELANTVVTYEVSSSFTGVVGFSVSPEGPFMPTVEIAIPLDASGSGTSATFALKALDIGHTLVNACADAPALGCILNPREVAVMGISSVEYNVIDSPLDPNPGPGGGLRIYPERQSEADAVDRRTVRVRVLATEARAGLAIHFTSIDVDDPSSDSRPVDANGRKGNDNFGISPGLLDRVAYTDPTGAAVQTLTVSTQPGDNFRVAASCSAAYLDGLQSDGSDVVDADGLALPTPRAEVTDLLTVWRKLHIEMDSMGLVTGNQVTGTIIEADPNVFDPTSDLKLQLPPDTKLERHQFTNGQIVIAGLGNFKVVGNTATTVEAYALLGAEAVGRTFVLVDDDDFNGDDPLTPDGDANENVFAPAVTFIEDGKDNGLCDGSAQNLYAAAYVCPVFDVGDNNDFVPFVASVYNTVEAKIATYDFDSMTSEADAGFWTVYLLGAYQGSPRFDLDHEVEGMAGAVDDHDGMGASIYLETIADDVRTRGLILGCSTGATVAHEIAHLLGATHSEGGLMESPCDKAVMTMSDKTIATIRKVAHP